MDRGPAVLACATIRADETRAVLLVSVLKAPSTGPVTLSGIVTGPMRGRDATLPDRVSLSPDGGSGSSARAAFTEPAFWTPDMPNLYRLQARLAQVGRADMEFDQMIGLRRLGVRGRSLWLDGRRWVPRSVGVTAESVRLEELKERRAAAEILDPPAAFLDATDRLGIAVLARPETVSGGLLAGDALRDRLAAWSRHPSIAVIVIPARAGAEVFTTVAADVMRSGMVVGLEADGLRPPVEVDAGLLAAVDCVVVDFPGSALPHAGWRAWLGKKPLVARCRWGPADVPEPSFSRDVAWQRRECDRLQARLAAWGQVEPSGDWAGYAVSTC